MSDISGYFIEDLKPGMTARYAREVTQEDIVQFAEVTGDNNPVHLDPEFAAQTRFGGRIAHGMLSAGYISAVLGTKLPGHGAIYLQQTMRFRAPVRPGDKVVAEVEVVEVLAEKGRCRLTTTCKVDDQVVLSGEALMMVPSRQS